MKKQIETTIQIETKLYDLYHDRLHLRCKVVVKDDVNKTQYIVIIDGFITIPIIQALDNLILPIIFLKDNNEDEIKEELSTFYTHILEKGLVSSSNIERFKLRTYNVLCFFIGMLWYIIKVT